MSVETAFSGYLVKDAGLCSHSNPKWATTLVRLERRNSPRRSNSLESLCVAGADHIHDRIRAVAESGGKDRKYPLGRWVTEYSSSSALRPRACRMRNFITTLSTRSVSVSSWEALLRFVSRTVGSVTDVLSSTTSEKKTVGESIDEKSLYRPFNFEWPCKSLWVENIYCAIENRKIFLIISELR
jgi:hypothetical protein